MNKYLRVTSTVLIFLSATLLIATIGLVTGYWMDPGLGYVLGTASGIVAAMFWVETE